MAAQTVLRNHIEKIPITSENGAAFYAFLFTAAPDLRQYFKGAEEIKAEEVADSERFQKQGRRLLTCVHLSVEVMHNDDVLKALIRDVVDKHRSFKIPWETMEAFFPAFQAFVEQFTCEMTDMQSDAWKELAKRWMKHAKEYHDSNKN